MSFATVTVTSEPSVFHAIKDRTAHLLIVNNDPADLDSLATFLSGNGFTITGTIHGQQGLALALGRPPDLILLDLYLPAPDAFEVLATLQVPRITRYIPVVLMGRDDVDSKVRGFELGAADYIVKPVEQVELLARITAHLRRRRLHSALEQRLRVLEQRHGAPDGNGAEPEWPEKDLDKIYWARQILEARLADPPSLKELAVTVGINQPRLSRGFRVLFGTTAFGFVREARLESAHQMLTETGRSVKAIALEVGYRNTGDLTRCIKQRYGLTPSELRARAEKTVMSGELSGGSPGSEPGGTGPIQDGSPGTLPWQL